MSIEGKKIAIKNQGMLIAKTIISAHLSGITSSYIAVPVVAVVAQCICMTNTLRLTPHQYFNNSGKIDKRKVRRHDRKIGVDTHSSRLVRVNTDQYGVIGFDPANSKDKSVRANVTIKNGLIANIAILDECGVHGDDKDAAE